MKVLTQKMSDSMMGTYFDQIGINVITLDPLKFNTAVIIWIHISVSVQNFIMCFLCFCDCV